MGPARYEHIRMFRERLRELIVGRRTPVLSKLVRPERRHDAGWIKIAYAASEQQGTSRAARPHSTNRF
jgi:hypothetical protein